jgi:hypothetical protein
MLEINPSIPAAKDVRVLHGDKETVTTLISLRREMLAQIRQVKLVTLMALARQYFPAEGPDYQTAAKFSLEVMDVLRALIQHGKDTQDVVDEESERLAPSLRRASGRSFEIHARLDALDKSLRSIGIDAEERRIALLNARVSADDVDRVIASGEKEREAHRNELNAECITLLIEQEALSRFLKTRNEQYLPAGFDASPPII